MLLTLYLIRFKENFQHRLDDLLKKFNEVISDLDGFNETKLFKEPLEKKSKEIILCYEQIDFSPLQDIPVLILLDLIKGMETVVDDVRRTYYKIEAAHEEEQKRKAEEGVEKEHTTNRTTNRETREIYEFKVAADEFSFYLKGPILRAANEGILFLNGKPGSGKSHLLADVALDRKKSGIPSIFLLGEHFPNQLPKIFIQQSLHPTKTIEDYLSGLESLGKSKQVRILFIIDAINEGVGKYIWKNSIAGLIEEFKHFKWIGFAFSYRSTYKDLVIPDNFNQPQITHTGFEGIEYKATKTFFEYYGIQQPAIPILHPEFSNPLFLKTFCLTLYRSGKRSIPEGYEGISKILTEYIEAVNKNLGTRLNYPYTRINLVSKAVDELIKFQIQHNSSTIPWEQAFALIEGLLQQYLDKRGFLDELLKEGLFIEDFFFNSATARYEEHGVIFNYERFNEHLKALYLLNQYSEVNVLKRAFASKGALRAIFYDKRGFSGLNAGLLNAFAIIIPERFGVELYEVFQPKEKYAQFDVYSSFLQSILWRKHATLSAHSWNYVKAFLNDERSMVEFLETILSVAAQPENFYNADFLHRLLNEKTVAERDLIWSLSIDKVWNWNRTNAIQRIIDWCWSEEDKKYTHDNSIFLLGKLLSWLFTSSNRKLRDKATKAFASLFINRTHLLPGIIEEFKTVNDAYVLERVIGGAFGAITHTNHLSNNTSVAQYVYDEFFRSRKPPLNVLTRDYGKGIIQYVVSKGGVLDYDESNLYPPFDYTMPTDIPDQKWVASLERKKKGPYTDEERGQFKITHSVLGWDFARYILGTNHESSIPFTRYTQQSRTAYETLSKALKGLKKDYLKIYVNAVGIINETGEIGKKMRRIFKGDELKKRIDFSIGMKENAARFLKEKFKPNEWGMFEDAQPYIEDALGTSTHDRKRFDVNIVQRYILKKVFDLGWNKKDFGKYDFNLDEGYGATKPERIGKKYQWIGYYEIMALLSDNYDFLSQYSQNDLPYIGTWQHNFRNIDPTALLKADDEQEYESKYADNDWWVKEVYSNWNEDRNTWLQRFNDMPDLQNLIVVEDDKKEQWYLLYDQIVWQSPKPLGKQRYKAGRKEIWVDVKAFLLRKQDQAKLLHKASSKLYWIRNEVPENPHYYHVYLGELYYSQSYKHQVKDFIEDFPYISVGSDKERIHAIHTVEDYGFESEYDLSGKVRTYKPSKFLFDLLKAETGRNDACIYDKQGNIIAYDTGAFAKLESRAFLIKRSVLDECLKKHDLEIGWFFCGEKEDIGASVHYVYRMLYSGFITFVDGKTEIRHHHQLER